MKDKRLEHIDRLLKTAPKLSTAATFSPSSLVDLANELAPHFIRHYAPSPHSMDSIDSAKGTRRQPYSDRVLSDFEHKFSLDMSWEGGVFHPWEAHARFEYNPGNNSYLFSEYWRFEDGRGIVQKLP